MIDNNSYHKINPNNHINHFNNQNQNRNQIHYIRNY